ncbi:mpv17-like protein [Ictalurus punctatus]|uniref:Mpv17-like protein n=1 Tax=Ictalurus punctatus TaxID=7998 RepID=A0A2D0PPY9_ICTPU|nr:mpv17-like protein [Ictalurus punctatus]
MRKVFPWLTNVSLYGCLFAGGDLLHQRVTHQDGTELDWKRTRNVALVAFCFHGNWNYFWLRALERRFPGRSLGMVLSKLALDQSFASPLATSVFYTGVSVLEGKEDVFEDWREKFFNTYKTGLMYWPFMQFLNFVLMPLYLRTVFMGCSAFLWAAFLCFSQQSGDGTAATALAWITTSEKRIVSRSANEEK